MGDSELVTSIVAGDPEGLAEAYDKYAGDLYSYCRTLLREPDDAADVVQDTFVIAASKLGGLRDPARLRAWLFAVARNECLHRLKARRRATPLQDAPELADDSADVGAGAERAETVALVRAAIGGLNDSERDAITQLSHGLEVAEVAAVLGVSRNHAYALFSRAREQLEASVAVLLVGRAGRRDCAVLDELLGDWDGRLTARLRRRVGRHINRCLVCSARRRQELTPALLYGLAPWALLGMVAGHAAQGAGSALGSVSQLGGAGQLTGLLAQVRAEVLRLTAGAGPHGAGPHGAASLTAGGQSMPSFGASGFPRPVHAGHLGLLPRHVPAAGVTTAAAAAAAAAVVATTVVPHLGPARKLPGGGGPTSSAPGAPAPAIGPRGGPSATPTTVPIASGPTSSVVRHGGGGPASTVSGTAAGGTPPGGGPTGPTALPSTLAPASTQTVPATTTVVATLRAGTLTVSPKTVLLSPLLGGSLTLTASGGPVGWTITEPASLIGKLTVSPASGILSAGDSATVTITVTGLATLDARLVVNPGGQLVTVLLGLG
jgi:RNA polymerase sigma factor (sigma-70 family)